MAKRKYTKLAIFDFDGTLVDSGTPERFKPIYKEKTGKDWPHKGWWSKRDSLDMNIFEITTIPAVIEDYKKVRMEHYTLTVMMTGRIVPLNQQVKAVLDYHGLLFDEYHFNNGGETCDFKMSEMEKILAKYPSIRELHIWDDRISHIPRFEAWGNTLDLDKFGITVVPGGNVEPATGVPSL